MDVHHSHANGGITSSTNAQSSFAAELAQALRESEAAPPPSDAKVVAATYRELHFDFPTNLSARGCRILARKLLDNNETDYILSERLVEGLYQAQALDSVVAVTTAKRTGPSSSSESPGDAADSPSLLQRQDTGEDPSSSLSSALALLAVAVHALIPLKILLSDNLDECKQLLGSFRGTHVSTTGDGQGVEEEDGQGQEQLDETDASEDLVVPILNGNGHAPVHDDDLAEVWAEESDPSDYGYDDNDNDGVGEAVGANTSTQDSALPREYSDPSMTDASPTDIAQGVTNLLRVATFAKVSSLPTEDWKRLLLSEKLTQLALVLLIPTASRSIVLQQEYSHAHWQQLATVPIHLLRDAALQTATTTKTGTQQSTLLRPTLLQDYTQLLRAMLQVDNVQTSGPTGGAGSPVATLHSVAPASLMGISLTASLCTYSIDECSAAISATQRLVLESTNDLAHLLEQSQPSNTGAAQEQLTIPWTFLPLFAVLTTRPTTSQCPPLTAQQYQSLLNSGLLRMWLNWWDQHVPETSSLRLDVQHSVLDLSIASPKLIGKYAWRFPGFAKHVTNSAFVEESSELSLETVHKLSDAVLWNLIGTELAASNGSSSSVVKVQWKNEPQSTKSNAPPSTKDCQEQARTGFERLGRSVLLMVSNWEKRRSEQHAMLEPRSIAEHGGTVARFTQMLECIVVHPILSSAFMDIMGSSDQGAREDVSDEAAATLRQSVLDPLQTLTSSWQCTSTVDSISNSARTKTKPEDADEDEGDNPLPTAVEPNIGKRIVQQQQQDKVMRALHKSLKQLQSLLLDGPNNDGSIAGSTNRLTSSKTD